ncbi:metallophosphoesterase [Dactylosporangium sp. CA-092794]|uniref:metallophosphoesterase n=1 Tax=Dactylosporangium sp. CA-092794 TaxID=3239929 RepID=UPI003D8B962A
MATTEAVPGAAVRRRSLLRPLVFAATITLVLALLFGVPWWSLVMAGNQWPGVVQVLGTVVFGLALVVFPVTMFLGHGRGVDWAARTGDTILGAVWILFVWALAGDLLRLALLAGGVDDPVRSRVAAASTAVVALGLGIWGYREAMRIPRVRRVEVRIPRLGAGLDGLRVVLLTDTHYGPIDRAAWSRGVTEVVNRLDADIVAHTGDIADGTVAQRTGQAAPLADVRARLARVYVTGNHEYFGEADGWLGHMRTLGWEPLHNRHLVVERGGDRLVVAGVDDRTAAGSGLEGHRADHALALDGADPQLPVLLLAHQPKQIDAAVTHGVDLQLSGHTHGGQIWPFHYLVRVDQPVVQGLTRHGARTQLFTSRGTGFWGPPFRVFAPSEITELTLRAGE